MKYKFPILLLLLFCYFAAINMAINHNGASSKNGFRLTSPAFANHGYIPARHACDGENLSPALQWAHAPQNTQSFALIVDDPDVPEKKWTHWVLFNIPATTSHLPEGDQSTDYISGETDFYYMRHGIWQYAGPCPPTLHHYHFTLYALDTKLDLKADSTKEDLLAAMENHILDQVTLIGLYERKK